MALTGPIKVGTEFFLATLEAERMLKEKNIYAKQSGGVWA